jgi:DNA-binding NarL/FixJ family response regulator
VGEYLAVRALALACLNRPDRALAIADHADEATRTCEVRCLTAAVRAVVGIRRGSDAAALDFYAIVSERGAVDSLVTGYRAEPDLLRPLLLAHLREELRTIMARANDTELLEQAISRSSELSLLTPREHEVLQLLALGNSNREIAARLVITEVTAKVHVRHILKKLP